MSEPTLTISAGSAKYVAGLLLLAILLPFLAFPAPAQAQLGGLSGNIGGLIPGQCLQDLFGAIGDIFGGIFGGGGGSGSGGFGQDEFDLDIFKSGGSGSGGASLVVPVHDAKNLKQNKITAASTKQLNQKSCLDALMTAVLKVTIAVVRDMVLQWIITGNFGLPVFSTSFMVDLSKTAENASRIFLSQLLKINFCTGISPPSPKNFFAGFDFNLACTLPAGANSAQQRNHLLFLELYNRQEYFRQISTEEYLARNDAQTNLAYTQVEIRRLRAESIAQAVAARSGEYLAGQGFLPIKDARGNTTSPGRAVAELVMQSQIVSPIRQTDVADDIQTAISAILDTAIKVLINKGFGAVFGS